MTSILSGRTFVSSIAGLAMVSAVLAAQNPPVPAQTAPVQKPAVEEVTLTGCVIQGSGPAVFLFDNAKVEKSTTDKGRRFLLAVGKDDVALVNHVNHQVTIQGSAETKVAPVPAAGQQPLESELPKLTIQGLTMVSRTCTGA